ncbi:hypothetical protein KC363_g194 [Hortaea werneckii]|nr:hypothetical protein KC363_g194 [Hortaea werneckii]
MPFEAHVLTSHTLVEREPISVHLKIIFMAYNSSSMPHSSWNSSPGTELDLWPTKSSFAAWNSMSTSVRSWDIDEALIDDPSRRRPRTQVSLFFPIVTVKQARKRKATFTKSQCEEQLSVKKVGAEYHAS